MSMAECLDRPTHYHVQLELQDKAHTIKGLVVCNSRDLEPLRLLKGLALGCYL